jgi:hypothetical protein
LKPFFVIKEKNLMLTKAKTTTHETSQVVEQKSTANAPKSLFC